MVHCSSLSHRSRKYSNQLQIPCVCTVKSTMFVKALSKVECNVRLSIGTWDERAAVVLLSQQERTGKTPYCHQEAAAWSPPPEADMQNLAVRILSDLYWADGPALYSDQRGASPPQVGICEAKCLLPDKNQTIIKNSISRMGGPMEGRANVIPGKWFQKWFVGGSRSSSLRTSNSLL